MVLTNIRKQQNNNKITKKVFIFTNEHFLVAVAALNSKTLKRFPSL